MALYDFSHPDDPSKVITLVQGMNDEHVYVDEDGIKWERIFYAPTASIDTKIDPNSPTDFVNKTANKKGTVGDILDASKAASEARAAERGGVDPVKQKHYDDYAKKCGGSRCHQEIREKAAKVIEIQDAYSHFKMSRGYYFFLSDFSCRGSKTTVKL